MLDCLGSPTWARTTETLTNGAASKRLFVKNSRVHFRLIGFSFQSAPGSHLKIDMVLARDWKNQKGVLLLASGLVLSDTMVRQIQGVAKRGGLPLTLAVKRHCRPPVIRSTHNWRFLGCGSVGTRRM